MTERKKDLSHESKIKEFGRFLQNERARVGLRQIEVAEALGYKCPQYISNFERGTCLPSLDSLPVLAELYSVEPRVLADFMIDIYSEKIRSVFEDE